MITVAELDDTGDVAELADDNELVLEDSVPAVVDVVPDDDAVLETAVDADDRGDVEIDVGEGSARVVLKDAAGAVVVVEAGGVGMSNVVVNEGANGSDCA